MTIELRPRDVAGLLESAGGLCGGTGIAPILRPAHEIVVLVEVRHGAG